MEVMLDFRRLVKRVAVRAEVPGYIVESIVEELGKEVCETLAKGVKVKVRGLGMFRPVHKQIKARGEVGDICFIPMRWKIAFRPCDMMKEAIDALPIRYKKMRCVAGRRIEDVAMKYNVRPSRPLGTVEGRKWEEDNGDG